MFSKSLSPCLALLPVPHSARCLALLCCLALTGCGSSPRDALVPEPELPPQQSSEPGGTVPDTAGEPSAADPSAPEPADLPSVPSDSAAASDSGAVPGSSAAGNDTPVAIHGALRVADGQLVDQKDTPFQLYGMSTHGLAWFPQYVNRDAFRTLRDDWNTNCVRLAMYTAEYGGYCTGGDREALKSLVKDGIEYATELGMYVIVDWHILSDQDPNVYKQDALEFFDEISAQYADYDNILYEICNEPNGSAGWEQVKAYAEEVIPVIRANDSDALILVGTPTWCQDIDRAAADPLSADNILYTLHFYAGTHKDDLRKRLEACVEKGLPVFVSEFGMCDASGSGANDFDSAAQWLDLLDRRGISYLCWNLANKEESSSVLVPGCDRLSDWTEEDLSEAGSWILERFRGKH